MLGFSVPPKWGWNSHVVAITKTASKKTGALICCAVSFCVLELCFISINLLSELVQNTVAMSGLVPLIVTWIFWIRYGDGHVELLVLH